MELLSQFEQHLLENLKVSRKTLRNYRSDLAHFSKWFGGSTKELVKNFNASLLVEYKNGHLENNIPAATINRRLSALRNFGRFLAFSGFIASDPTEDVENISKTKKEQTHAEKLEEVAVRFKKYLEAEGLSKSTLKNYMSDINQFYAWYFRQKATSA